MQIKYKDKPSDKVLKRYKEKLEQFLSAQDISIEIELWDNPLKMESYTNSNLTKVNYLWLKSIKITSPEVDELGVNYIRLGIDEDIKEHDIWTDAWKIQDELYRHLKKRPTSPPQKSADPYWRLWDYLER